MGTKVEPLWHARFRATIKVTTDTFSVDGSAPGVIFVRSVKRSGEALELFGKSISQLYAGAWRTSLEFEGQPLGALGQPESAFGGQKVIVRGSSEETAYIHEQAEKERLSAVAAERAAEEARKLLAQAAKLLIGTWRDENSVATYRADGTASFKFDSGLRQERTWVIEGDLILWRLIERNGSPEVRDLGSAKILSITASQLVIQDIPGRSVWHLARVN